MALEYGGPATPNTSFLAADLNGDAQADLVICDRDTGAAVAYGHADGGLDPFVAIAGLDPCDRLTPCDLDADGDLDVIVERRLDFERAMVEVHRADPDGWVATGAFADPPDLWQTATMCHGQEVIRWSGTATGGTLRSPPPFYWVGAGDAFGTGTGSSGGIIPPSSGNVQRLLALGQAQEGLAGNFTRFLIDRHGIAAYLAFYASVGEKDPLLVIEAAHAEHFGESLTETDLAFVAERGWCRAQSYRFKLFECSTSSIAWDDDSLLLRRSLACGEDDVVGPFGGQTAQSLSTLEVVTAGTFEISLAADEPAGMVYTVPLSYRAIDGRIRP